MPQYPNVLAGQRITANLLLSLMPVFVYKTANTDRASTITLADDPDLTLQLEANATYHAEVHLFYGAISAAGFQTAWTVPAGTSGNRWALGSGSTQTTSDNVSGRFGVHNFATACEYGDRNNISNLMGAYERAIVTTSSAGTLALQWSQVVSNATAARVAVGSFMQVTRLA